MIRITRVARAEDAETLRVEGRLTHETVEELRMACETVLAEQRPLQLDVSGLRFVDPAGVALLHGLQKRGGRLRGCSGFVNELLRDRDRAALAGGGTPVSEPSDEAVLVEQLRGGDPQACDLLVRRYGARMLATARRVVGNEDDAQDVVQEAFLAALRAIDGFAGAARLSTWLHRIVVNTALMRLRSRRRRREESIDGLLPRFDDDGHWAEPVARWETATDALFERRERRAMVRTAIERLPLNYRSVLVLRDIEELDTDEAASLLGVSPNAVKTRLHRARQALRTLLQQEFQLADRDGREPESRPAPRSA